MPKGDQQVQDTLKGLKVAILVTDGFGAFTCLAILDADGRDARTKWFES
jgi:hypothetical protein